MKIIFYNFQNAEKRGIFCVSAKKFLSCLSFTDTVDGAELSAFHNNLLRFLLAWYHYVFTKMRLIMKKINETLLMVKLVLVEEVSLKQWKLRNCQWNWLKIECGIFSKLQAAPLFCRKIQSFCVPLVLEWVWITNRHRVALVPVKPIETKSNVRHTRKSNV